MPQQIEIIVNLIEKLQKLHGDQNKAINIETAELYSAIALIRNILELINEYNKEGSPIKLPRSDRLRNKLTHCPFMVNTEELMNFIDQKLNSTFIEHIRDGQSIENNFFEDSGLYRSLREYPTDRDGMLQHMRENTLNYAFHCLDFLQKFIKYSNSITADSSDTHLLAAQFLLEQFLIITNVLKQVVPKLEVLNQDKFMRQFLNEQFFNQYIQQIRNPSAHGYILKPQSFQQLTPTMEKLLSSLQEGFSTDQLKCFSRPTAKSCPRLKKIHSANVESLGGTLHIIEDHLQKQQEEQKIKEKLQQEKQAQQDEFRQNMMKKIAEKRAELAAAEEAKKQKIDPTQQAINESLKDAEKTGKIGSRNIEGWEMQDVRDEGNCFYEAIAEQLKSLNHPIIQMVPEGTAIHDWLRLQVQGADFQDREWAEDITIDQFVSRFPEIALAIVDTKNHQAGFIGYYHNGIMLVTNVGDDTDLLIPDEKKVIKIAATGNHYLSVISHPALSNGAVREAWRLVPDISSSSCGAVIEKTKHEAKP